MRIAVFSDIHSNYIALDACMDYIQQHKVEKIIFLGDNISDCPAPRLTLERIAALNKEYDTVHIRGNREEYFIDHEDGKSNDWEYSSYKGSLLYTFEHITTEDIREFRHMDHQKVVQFEGMDGIQLVHGSPNSSRELLHAHGDNTKHYLQQMSVGLMLGGHTHRQFAYPYKDKFLVNPGSIGVAIGKPRTANFAILEWKKDGWEAELITVPFDYEKLRTHFMRSSLMEKAKWWPKCILKSMETGVNVGPLCAKKAFDLASQDKIEIVNGTIPEKYWDRAAKIIGV
ncbi:metallophosphoesterase family protein [[Clostridium] polysaccharolyticum]|uniref:Phosphoesterase n=1 Tax=[Clostridium] polysaccharolyticum TaxID=29364 RepID=A0A1H9Y640_9FIRM|nr:YfcE family phosphodiesterase [[Clostridium] polysaccharolyticum]SES64360.1 phosphoesterase, MJ0936 family [[Clostridium] polysaccharolyticum]